jgi:4-hydroxy-tetrahydrodipicolinate reductase
MKIALIGNGAMGQLVAQQARAAGHEIATIVTSKERDLNTNQLKDKLSGHGADAGRGAEAGHVEVAIDFSVGEAVLKNIEACALAGVPLVEGTTGWKAHEAAAKQIVNEHNAALVYGANFSIGVNLFYRIVDRAATLFASVEDYAPFIEEAHHMRKRDAPSGTALQLRELMAKHLGPEIPTASTRAGYIPGTHRVGFDSEADQILLVHTARSRRGFASGALLAAHWVIGRTGVFEFADVIEEIVNR